jgi:hypothetical protein
VKRTVMVRVSRTGIRVSHSPQDLLRLRREFERRHFVRLPKILDRNLLKIVCAAIRKSEFCERSHAGIGSNKELCLAARSTAAGLLHLLLNSEGLFQVVRDITQCRPIGCFAGRIYRVTPGCGHRDAWHSDMGDHRLVAMSINLSPSSYLGGALQMRARGSHRILRQVPNTGFGDAILFRISSDLEHRVSDVQGTASKTALAGWFKAEPSFRSMLGRGSRPA